MTDFVVSQPAVFLTNITVGAGPPAQSGTIRLGNADDIVARDQNDGSDFNVISFDASANMIFGDTGMPFISFVSGQFNFAGDIDITGDLVVTGDLSGDFTVSGDLQIGTLVAANQTFEAIPEIFTALNGNIEVFDPATLEVSVLNDGAFPDSTNWAGAGEWSDVIAGNTTFTFSSTGNGTLTQTFAQRDTGNEGSNNRWYKAVYTLTSVTNSGSMLLTITNVFAAAAVTLPVTANGTFTVYFQSNPTTTDSGDFVLDVTGATAGDTFTMDDLSVREVLGGDIIVAGRMTGGGALGIRVDGEGDAFFDGVILFGIAENRAETGTIRFHNSDSIVWRDDDGDNDITMFAFGTADLFEIGDQANPTRAAMIHFFTPELVLPAGKFRITHDNSAAFLVETAGNASVFNVDTLAPLVTVAAPLTVTGQTLTLGAGDGDTEIVWTGCATFFSGVSSSPEEYRIGGGSDSSDTAAAVLAINNTDLKIRNAVANGQSMDIKTTSALTAAMTSGQTVTVSGIIPAGSFLVGITTRVTTEITGPAGFDIGDGSTTDRWGNSILVALNTTSDITDYVAEGSGTFAAAGDVVLTSDGVDFTAGQVRVTVHYMQLVAPTS